MNKFETGKRYFATSICDSNCRWEYTIEKRTDKSLWINGKRFAIHTVDNDEMVFPEGRYSMCPVLRPERLVA